MLLLFDSRDVLDHLLILVVHVMHSSPCKRSLINNKNHFISIPFLSTYKSKLRRDKCETG